MDCTRFALWAWLLFPAAAFSLVGCGTETASQDETDRHARFEPAPLDGSSFGGLVRRMPPADYPCQPVQSLGPPQVASRPLDQSAGTAPTEASTPPEEQPTPELSADGFPDPTFVDEPRAETPAATSNGPELSAAQQSTAAPNEAVVDDSVVPADELALGSLPSGSQSETLESSELPWARSIEQTPEMKAVLLEADQMNRRGFSLAERGAMYSARREFIGALRTIARAIDSQQQSQVYARALSAGLTALRESKDFAKVGHDDPSTIARIAAGHTTPILKQLTCRTSIEAAGRYYTYAQEQLAFASGQHVPAANALYGMGKVTTASAGPNDWDAKAQAMVWYQSALLCDGRSFRASHELGVLLAKAGKLETARAMFQRSVAIAPHPMTWQNLAIVHERLGESPQAQQARRAAQAMGDKSLGGPSVRWVDPGTFARTTSTTEGLLPPQQPVAKAAAPAPAPATPKKVATWPWKAFSH